MHSNHSLFTGPHGVPIYAEHIPGARTVSMTVKVFVGSADDRSVGDDGLYHWFEHSPFRGTESFPTDEHFAARLGRHATQCNASTSELATEYQISVPLTHWKEGLTYCLDLVGRPLLHHEGNQAEQIIILSEISDRLADPEYRVDRRVQDVLFPHHPTSHAILGTAKTVSSMDTALIQRAHKEGYSWNRVVVCVSGGMVQDMVADHIANYITAHPLNELSVRRSESSYGQCVVGNHGIIREQSESSSTFVRLYIPVPSYALGSGETDAWAMTYRMFTAGGLKSPILRVLRQERPLVYGAAMGRKAGPDRWYFTVEASTRPGNGEKVLEHARLLFARADLLTPERLAWTHDYMQGMDAYLLPDPAYSVDDALHTLDLWGELMSREERRRRALAVSYERIRYCLDVLAANLDQSAAFIFEGDT